MVETNDIKYTRTAVPVAINKEWLLKESCRADEANDWVSR